MNKSLFSVLDDGSSDSEENQILIKKEDGGDDYQDKKQNEFFKDTQKGILLESDYLTLNPININNYDLVIEKKDNNNNEIKSKKKEKSVTFSVDGGGQIGSGDGNDTGNKKSFDPTTPRKNRFNNKGGEKGKFGKRREHYNNSTSNYSTGSSDSLNYQVETSNNENNFGGDGNTTSIVYQVESSENNFNYSSQEVTSEQSQQEQTEVQYTYQVETSTTTTTTSTGIDELVTQTNESLFITSTSTKSTSTSKIGLKEYYDSLNREKVAQIPIDERKVLTSGDIDKDESGKIEGDSGSTTEKYIELKPKDRTKLVKSKSKAKQKFENKNNNNNLPSSTKNVIVLPPEFSHYGKPKKVSDKKDYSQSNSTFNKRPTNLSNRNYDNNNQNQYQYQRSHNHQYQHQHKPQYKQRGGGGGHYNHHQQQEKEKEKNYNEQEINLVPDELPIL